MVRLRVGALRGCLRCDVQVAAGFAVVRVGPQVGLAAVVHGVVVRGRRCRNRRSRSGTQGASPHWSLRQNGVLARLGRADRAAAAAVVHVVAHVLFAAVLALIVAIGKARVAADLIGRLQAGSNGAPWIAGQVVPHAPQLAASVLVFTSQPSFGSPLQSSKGGVQLSTLHTPPAHAATAFGSEHGVAQSPQ